MAWVTGLIGAAGSGINSLGQNQAAKQQNKFWQPSTINNYAQQFNPWAWNAIQGRQGNTAFSRDMYNIAQGKDISPYLLNQPLNQINRGADTNMAKMQSMLGRSNMSGGLANGYALSNRMGRQNATANLYQNYGQWREQQRRTDMDWLMNQINRSQAQGGELAGKHQFKQNPMQMIGGMVNGFIGGMGLGALGGGGGNKGGPATGRGTQDSWGNIPGPSNSTPGYQDTMQYPYGGRAPQASGGGGNMGASSIQGSGGWGGGMGQGKSWYGGWQQPRSSGNSWYQGWKQ